MPRVYTCLEQGDVFVDSLVCDKRMNLLFMSLYGRDGSIQQMLSRIHLGSREDGISTITLKDPASGRSAPKVFVGDPRRLEKLTGQLAKSLFGKLAQVWIYDPVMVKPDKPNKRGWVFFDGTQDQGQREAQVWALIKYLSPLPLLDHWERDIKALIQRSGSEAGIHQSVHVGPVGGFEVVLPPDFEDLVSREIQESRIHLDPSIQLAQAAA